MSACVLVCVLEEEGACWCVSACVFMCECLCESACVYWCVCGGGGSVETNLVEDFEGFLHGHLDLGLSFHMQLLHKNLEVLHTGQRRGHLEREHYSYALHMDMQ